MDSPLHPKLTTTTIRLADQRLSSRSALPPWGWSSCGPPFHAPLVSVEFEAALSLRTVKALSRETIEY